MEQPYGTSELPQTAAIPVGRVNGSHLQLELHAALAAIDIETNAIRLLIGDVDRYDRTILPLLHAGAIVLADRGSVPAACHQRIQGCSSVLVVGHEPQLSELCSILLAGDKELKLRLKKGRMFKLTCETFAPKCATLEWLTPKQLRSLSG